MTGGFWGRPFGHNQNLIFWKSFFHFLEIMFHFLEIIFWGSFFGVSECFHVTPYGSVSLIAMVVVLFGGFQI